MTRTLDAADYWKLRAIWSDTQRCEAVARHALADVAVAQQQHAAAFRALGFTLPVGQVTLDDATLTITVPDAGDAP